MHVHASGQMTLSERRLPDFSIRNKWNRSRKQGVGNGPVEEGKTPDGNTRLSVLSIRHSITNIHYMKIIKFDSTTGNVNGGIVL